MTVATWGRVLPIDLQEAADAGLAHAVTFETRLPVSTINASVQRALRHHLRSTKRANRSLLIGERVDASIR